MPENNVYTVELPRNQPRKDEPKAYKKKGSYYSAPAPAAPQLPAADESGYISARDAVTDTAGVRPQYSSQYDDMLEGLYDSIMGREAFSYDAAADPLYRQYRDSYTADGELAMRNTMGQVAALTGGYGSSYAQAVGQQQYGEYMRQLSDMLPELYKQAYGEYQDEGDWLMRQYGLVSSMEADDYERYRDSVYDWDQQRAFDLKLRDQEYDRLLYMMQNSRYMPGEKQLAAAGLTKKQAEQLYWSFHPEG